MTFREYLKIKYADPQTRDIEPIFKDANGSARTFWIDDDPKYNANVVKVVPTGEFSEDVYTDWRGSDARTFNTMDIPTSAKRENESNEDTFLRIIDTFMGEYEVKTLDFSYSALGQWVIDCDKGFTEGTFPVAWEENADGFLTDYYVYLEDMTLRHIKVNY